MSHYYTILGEPRHFVDRKAGGLRPTTIADARKHGWLPSVTTILQVLHKPALVEWLCRNAVIAALTTPRRTGEDLDAFADRILAFDANEESAKARDLGTEIHDAIALALAGKEYPLALKSYVEAALAECAEFGAVARMETVVVGSGYAGRLDAQFAKEGLITVCDFKSCKRLPRDRSYSEHMLQLAAYAQALGNPGDNRIQVANVYVSTSSPGDVATFVNPDWQHSCATFAALVKYWQLANNYDPHK